jgi:hypothetical protein
VPERYEKLLIELIIIGCLLFNYVLCVLNTHLISVSDKHVIGAELLLMTAAWGVLMWGGKRLQVGWLCLALAFVVIPVFVMILREQPMPKTVRDIVIVPTFVLLGIRYGRRNLSSFVVALCALVFFVAFIEAGFTEQYQQYVDVISYYISKGAAEEQATFHDDKLYISAIRPVGRMFGSFLFGDLRASSIFLEPVSLGMFAAIVAFYALAAGDEITRGRRTACLAFAFAVVVLCDGRLAFGLVIVALAARFIVFRLSKIVLFLYLPVTVGISLLLQIMLPFTPQGDNLLGRKHHCDTPAVDDAGRLPGSFSFRLTDRGQRHSLSDRECRPDRCSDLLVRPLCFVSIRRPVTADFRSYGLPLFKHILGRMCLDIHDQDGSVPLVSVRDVSGFQARQKTLVPGRIPSATRNISAFQDVTSVEHI